jgi:predicted NBD/HSP70 family sugar kinase
MKSVNVGLTTRARVLGALVSVGRSTRAALAQQTGLSKATISRLVNQLSNEGIVREAETISANRRGPHETALEFVTDNARICGVDLGASSVRLVLIDLSGRVLQVERQGTPATADAKGLASWLVDRIKRLSPERAIRSSLRTTAIGVPGVVHPSTNAIRWAPNLPSIEGVAFTSLVRSRLKIPVVFDNDANLALLGELYFGAARKVRSAVMFTVGTGVGAGVAIDGKLLRGRTGFAGEFGYVLAGPELGSFEQSVAGPGLIKQAGRLGVRGSQPRELLDEMATPTLKELRGQVEEAYLTVLSAAVCAYEPELIVLGGGAAASSEAWLERLQSALARRVPMAPPIVGSALGDLAGTFGAVVVALEEAYASLGLVLEELNGVSAVARLAATASEIKGL